METILEIIFGLVIGIVLVVIEGAGALVAIPLFLYIFHFPFLFALCSSLFLITLGSMPPILLSLRDKTLDLKAGVHLGISGAIGAIIGTQIISLFPPKILLILFLVMAALTALDILLPSKLIKTDGVFIRWSGSQVFVLGLIAGVLTCFTGIGAAFLIRPVLRVIKKIEETKLHGTTLVIIASNSFFGIVGYHPLLLFEKLNFLFLSLGVLLGGILGYFLYKKSLMKIQIKLLFGVLFLGLILFMKAFS